MIAPTHETIVSSLCAAQRSISCAIEQISATNQGDAAAVSAIPCMSYSITTTRVTTHPIQLILAFS